MVFSLYLFIFQFLPIALLLYYASPARLRHLVLTLLSYGFYGWANPAFLILIAVSTLIDYVAALVIVGRTPLDANDAPMVSGRARSTRQRVALVVSLVSNLSLLGFFKYFNFGVDSLNAAAGALGLATPLLDTTLRVMLPLGISFYTFQSMSYTIDVYRGQRGRDAQPRRLRLLRLHVSPTGRRADRALRGGGRPAADADAHGREVRARRGDVRPGPRPRRCCSPIPCAMADAVFNAGRLDGLRRVAGPVGVRLPDLLRLQRLLRHGDRPGADARLRLPEELRLARTSPSRSRNSGGAGTCRCRRGCATTCTSRSAATGEGRAGPTSTCSW